MDRLQDSAPCGGILTRNPETANRELGGCVLSPSEETQARRLPIFEAVGDYQRSQTGKARRGRAQNTKTNGVTEVRHV